MANDKPTLTRRRVLGGMATIGVAGAVGAGTWAQMKDTEEFSNEVTAGVLDLTVNGGSQELPLEFGPVQNGEAYLKTVILNNTGNIAGRYLCVEIVDVSGSENGVTEPEENLGDGNAEGELAQYLSVRMAIRNPQFGAPTRNFYSQTPILASDTRQCVALDRPLDGPAVLNVDVVVAEEDISEAMSDTVEFVIAVTLSDDPLN